MRHAGRRLLFSLPIFAVALYSNAQPEFEHLSIREGLSQSTVNCIVQDREGYMWFGTQDGLNRYDGYSFLTLKHDPAESTSLSDNYVTSLCVDGDGVLWVGTRNGLNCWRPEARSFRRYSARGDNCRAICEDHDHVLWVGTARGLVRIDARRSTAELFAPPGPVGTALSDVRSVLCDFSGVLWIAANARLFRVDPAGERVTMHDIPGHAKVWSIAADDNGNLWVGCYDGGLFAFDAKSLTFRLVDGKPHSTASEEWVWSLHKDRAGDLWVGTGGAGLYRYSPGRSKRHYEFRDNYVLALYEDRSRVLWTGTGGGIERHDTKGERFGACTFSARGGTIDPEVWSICEGKGGAVWVGTNGGVCRMDSEGVIRRAKELPGYVAQSLLEDQQGVLWVGTEMDGLIAWDTRHIRPTRVFRATSGSAQCISSNSIQTVYGARDGTLWVGTADGVLNRFHPATGTFRRFTIFPADPSTPHALRCIAEDGTGVLWLGAERGGIYGVKIDRDTLKPIPAVPRSLASDDVYCVHPEAEGVLWIGTAEGLVRWDRRTAETSRYTTKEGLPNDVVYGILEDRTRKLWISTNRGLSRFDPSTKTFRNYDGRDGLQSDEFNTGAYAQGGDGKLYFGGMNGVNAFYPEQIRDNALPPSIVFTEFRIFDRVAPAPWLNEAGGAVELGPGENFFSVEFAALDYSCPPKNQYAYKLEGFDDDWIRCGTRRYAAYTNLGGGNYVLRVRGSNNDGTWNADGAALHIRILPPFWRTGWFQAFSVLMVLLVSGGLVRSRFASLRRRAEAQQELSRQLLASQESERKRIGAGLHDSLGQNLLIIKNLADMGMTQSKDPGGAADTLQEISSLSARVLGEVREIAYDLRPYQLDQLGLTGALRSIVTRFGASSSVKFTASLDDIDGLFPKEQEINIFRIVQEALSNIVRHAGARNAAVTVKRREGEVKLTVADDGVGIAPGRRGFGLSGMAERARIVGGSLVVKSMPAGGTTIIATFSLQRRHHEHSD